MVKRFEDKKLDKFIQKRFRLSLDEYEVETVEGYREASEAEIVMYLVKSLVLSFHWNLFSNSWFAQNSFGPDGIWMHGGDVLLTQNKSPEQAIFELAGKILERE